MSSPSKFSFGGGDGKFTFGAALATGGAALAAVAAYCVLTRAFKPKSGASTGPSKAETPTAPEPAKEEPKSLKAALLGGIGGAGSPNSNDPSAASSPAAAGNSAEAVTTVNIGDMAAPVERPTTADGWTNLGFSIPQGEFAYVVPEATEPAAAESAAPHEQLSERRCYEIALSLDPNQGRAWFLLATELAAAERAQAEAREKLIAQGSSDDHQQKASAEATQKADDTSPAPAAAAEECDDDEDDDEAHAHEEWPEDDLRRRFFVSAQVGDETVYADDCYAKCLTLTSGDDQASKLARTPAWAGLALYLDKHDRLVSVFDESKDGMECLVAAVGGDHDYGVVCRSLARLICERAVPGVTVNDKSFEGKIMYSKALEFKEYESDPQVWLEAAVYLDKFPQTGEHPPAVRVRGKYMNKFDCLARSVELDRDNYASLEMLGAAMQPGRSVTLDGDEMTKLQVLERAVDKRPTRAENWLALADALHDPDSSATIDGKEYKQRLCWEEALKRDAENSFIWRKVCLAIPCGAAVEFDGKLRDEVDIAERAVELDPNASEAWHALGIALRPFRIAPRSVTIDGTTYDAPAALEKAVRMNPLSGLGSYLHLAKLHTVADQFLVGGLRSTKLGMLSGIVAHEPTNRIFWAALGWALLETEQGEKATARVVFDDFTPKQCFIQALLTNGNDGYCWGGLVEAAPGEEPIKVTDTQSFPREEAIISCLRHTNGQDPNGWYLLAMHLKGKPYGQNTVTIGEEIFGVRDSLLKAVMLSTEGSERILLPALRELALDMSDDEKLDVTVWLENAELFKRVNYDTAAASRRENCTETHSNLTRSAVRVMALELYDKCNRNIQHVFKTLPLTIWNDLAEALGDDATITFKGEELTRGDCLSRACPP